MELIVPGFQDPFLWIPWLFDLPVIDLAVSLCCRLWKIIFILLFFLVLLLLSLMK